MRSIIPVRIAGVGHSLPSKVVTSKELDHWLGFKPGHLEEVSGVISRYVCEGEDQIGLAVAASQIAMEEAEISKGDIDLVLSACGVPYQTLPATAPLVMHRLGIPEGRAAAYDVNATCLSFLSAFELAANKIAAGQCRTALIFSSEIASRALPWKEQPDVAALFGDGAAAAILTASPDGKSGIHASHFSTYPAAYDACEIGAGGTRFDFHREPEMFAHHAVFRMDGKELFRITHRHFPRFVEQLLNAAGWSLSDVDLVVPHQASPLALEHMIQRTGLEAARVVNIAARHGNQIAASIPTALAIAWRDGTISRGMRILMLGTSAGVSFGGMAIEV
ncbi:MAG: ketoacyl-ACP synthase III [Alphaproteobacteria bacterium]